MVSGLFLTAQADLRNFRDIGWKGDITIFVEIVLKCLTRTLLTSAQLAEQLWYFGSSTAMESSHQKTTSNKPVKVFQKLMVRAFQQTWPRHLKTRPGGKKTQQRLLTYTSLLSLKKLLTLGLTCLTSVSFFCTSSTFQLPRSFELLLCFMWGE